MVEEGDGVGYVYLVIQKKESYWAADQYNDTSKQNIRRVNREIGKRMQSIQGEGTEPCGKVRTRNAVAGRRFGGVLAFPQG